MLLNDKLAALDQIYAIYDRFIAGQQAHWEKYGYGNWGLHLAVRQEIIGKAGFEVRIGSLSEDLEENQQISLPSGHQLVLEPVQRQADRISVNGFDPCVVILNNDLSSGRPEILEGLAQEILPPLEVFGDRLQVFAIGGAALFCRCDLRFALQQRKAIGFGLILGPSHGTERQRPADQQADNNRSGSHLHAR